MIIDLLSSILPHYCCSCGQIGQILCEGCYYDIVSEPDGRCIACGQLAKADGSCRCRAKFSRSWSAGEHAGALKHLIAVSKFDSVKAGCDVQARLLDTALPSLPINTVVVAVPTIARHIRRRRYGHAERIASQLANRRHLAYRQLIGRRRQLVQRGAGRRVRIEQAEQSYRLNASLTPDTNYLLIDDVYTTGATIEAIVKLFLEAGARRSNIWVAVTARRYN